MTGRSSPSRRWSSVQSARRGTNVSGAVPKRQKNLGIESVCRLLKGKKKKGPPSPISLGKGGGGGKFFLSPFLDCRPQSRLHNSPPPDYAWRVLPCPSGVNEDSRGAGVVVVGVGLALVCATKRRKISKIPHPSPGGRHAPRAFAADMPCVCVYVRADVVLPGPECPRPLRYAHVGKNTLTHMFSMREKFFFLFLLSPVFVHLGVSSRRHFHGKKAIGRERGQTPYYALSTLCT